MPVKMCTYVCALRSVIHRYTSESNDKRNEKIDKNTKKNQIMRMNKKFVHFALFIHILTAFSQYESILFSINRIALTNYFWNMIHLQITSGKCTNRTTIGHSLTILINKYSFSIVKFVSWYVCTDSVDRKLTEKLQWN